MAEINAKIKLENNDGRDRVEVDRFSEDGYIFLEAFDGEGKRSACVILTDREARKVAKALRAASR
jgi:hypothetical protein